MYELTEAGQRALGVGTPYVTWTELTTFASRADVPLWVHGNVVSVDGVIIAHSALVLTVAEAAKALGVSEQTIYHRLRTGAMRGRLVRRVWLVPLSEIERLVIEDVQND